MNDQKRDRFLDRSRNGHPADCLDSHLKQLRHTSLVDCSPDDRRTGRHLDELVENLTDHQTDHRTDHRTEHRIDHLTEHLKDIDRHKDYTDHRTFRHLIRPNRTPVILFLCLHLLDRLNAHLFKCLSNLGRKPFDYHNSIVLFLIVLLGSTVTGAQHSACPSAKQINDLKPPNVNLNCDCTQTADGQKGASWEIMCYSVENLHNNGKRY